MQHKVYINLVLILAGIFLGFFGLINYQLYAAVRQAEKTVAANTAELDKITTFLNETFGGQARPEGESQ